MIKFKVKISSIKIIQILLCFVCVFCNVNSYAQTKTAKQVADSMRVEMQKEKHLRDSIIIVNKAKLQADILERKRLLDSTKTNRIAFRDSVKQVREEAKKVRDDIAKKKNNKSYLKEQEKIKKNRADSISYARAMKTEEIKKDRKTKSDATAKQRKNNLENTAKARKVSADSTAKARKENLAKLKEQRKKISENVTKNRKVIKDSLATVAKKKLELKIKLFKTPEEKQAAEAMKQHLKKNSQFSNQNFLKKPWTLPRKLYQNTVTRYNYFYNARKIYNETILAGQKKSKDDYSKLLNLESILNGASKEGVGLMDTIIRKCATDIQIHDPRSKWFDDLYFQMGKAYFVKGDNDNAILTFQYIANEYKDKPKKTQNTSSQKNKNEVDTSQKYSIATIENRKGRHIIDHRLVRNDALVYLAKAYLQAGAVSDAQTLIGILQTDKNFPKRLKSDVELLSAQMYLTNGSQTQAVEALQNALKDKSIKHNTKIRVTYLLGQLLAMQEDFKLSTKQFENVISMHPNIDMDFYAKLNIAKNYAKTPNSDLSNIESMFKAIINDGKYINYLDKAYLALGTIQAETNTEKAITSLNKAISFSKNNKSTKEQAFAVLGDLYFKQLNYKPSKLAYDSTLFYTDEATSKKNIEIGIRRNLLNDLVKELDVISYNDSLIALSKLSKKEQNAIAKKALKASKKQKINTDNEIGNIETTASDPNATPSGWYFSNINNLNAGLTKFQAVWGNRPNVDNWNRLAAINNLANTNTDNVKSENDTTLNVQESKDELQGIDKYLASIPKTTEALKHCNESRENSLYNASIIFYAGLNDYPKTIEYIELLLKDYPNTTYKSKAYYTLYLTYQKTKNITEANKYLALLNNTFPDDKLTKTANTKPQAQEQNAEKAAVVAYYNETYDMYKQNKFTEVLPRIQYAKSNYLDNTLLPKFKLLEALTNTNLKKYNDARTQLKMVIADYAGNEEATFAQDILALLNQKDSSGVDSLGAFNKLSTSFSKNNTVLKYTYEPNQPHYYMFILKKIDDRINPLKSAFSDFNGMKHSSEKIESSLYLIDEKSGVIFFKQFVNASFAQKYFNEVVSNKNIYSVMKNDEFDMAIISENNYTYFKNTRDLQGYLDFYKKNYK